MNIKSFGCSFIFGSELPDNMAAIENGWDRVARSSTQTWPALLAQHQGVNYQCYAVPGSGNLQILERLLNHCHGDPDDVYVIGWSWVDRFDYLDPNKHAYRATDPKTPWATIMPIDNTDLAKTYYKHLHSEYRDKLTSLIYIKTAIDTLQQKNCRFIMTFMDHILFKPEWEINPAITDLQNYIEPYMTTFEGKTFLEWSRSKGYPETDMWHPLEQAHARAAELLLSSSDIQNIIGC